MTTSLLRAVVALFALTFIVAACASDTGAEWTFAPVVAYSETDSPGDASPPAGDAATQQPAAAQEPAEPEVTAAAQEPAEPEVTAAAAQPSGEARVIELQADAALRFTDTSGQQIRDIPVTPGETITFQIDNTAGFDHNFYIGEDSQLMTPAGTTDTGIPTWATGVQTLDWVVPDDISNLKFGCTVPGHYALMQGTFSISE